ncbi:hypothetical protein RFI_29997 [Reticulomyxa filosa]|uniref:Kelch motif family protein n=1 Tax=Reticulomyxa filosa TaxID=46433 RepID=X6M1X3_RETFI|nr:hypothetical protein RFI_29997 [Reticulomyxa filosa]|eukprot:ETO07392.1 hypothetical protein RFI_29997 [Reticulomyxa filosa]
MESIEQKANLDIPNPFQTLTCLPISPRQTQCVAYKDEFLICGGCETNECYSYHTIKNQYKYICSYPSNVNIFGHCVVKYVNNNKDTNKSDITLLSFGGQDGNKIKHTLIMNYVSVWNDENENIKKHCNEWTPFIDNNNDNKIIIGSHEDDYQGARAIIGGSDNHLLFITYPPKNISIANLNTLKYIMHEDLPIDSETRNHCFISKENKNKNKNKNEMLLFCKNTGLSIKYDEDNNTLEFHKIRVCASLKMSESYGYIYINDFILFFGGDDLSISDKIHKYCITENKWIQYEQTLPVLLENCTAVLAENATFIHILGVINGSEESIHMKINVKEWMKEGGRQQQWMMEDKEIVDLEEINIELEEMKPHLDIRKLKVEKILIIFLFLFV